MSYTLIASQTLAADTASVSFTGIPQQYTDLHLEFTGTNGASGYTIQVGNGTVDTGSNYSRTQVLGDGATASSGRVSNESKSYITLTSGAGGMQTSTMNIMSYSNTSTYKTMLTRYSDVANYACAIVSLWRSTSAVNVITVSAGSNMPTGSTFKLWGVA